MRVTTESGAVYEFRDLSAAGIQWVRRFAGASVTYMRRDRAWVYVVQCDDIVVGKPMRLILRGVAEAGDTLRVTTPVTQVTNTVN